MVIKREMSSKTMENIRNLLTDIMYRAEKINDREICGTVDKCMALLDNLSQEIQFEDKELANTQ